MTQATSQKIYIFLNGKKDKLVPKLVPNIPLYLADGGLNILLQQNIEFEKAIFFGDFDSLTKESRFYLEKNALKFKVHQLKPNKDLTDFAALLDHIYDSHHNKILFIEIFGGLGGMREHEYANIAEMQKFIQALPLGGLCYFHDSVIVSSLPFTIKKRNRISARSSLDFFRNSSFERSLLNFSIFTDTGSVHIEGALYSGTFKLNRPSHGISNAMLQDEVKVTPNGTLITMLSKNLCLKI